MSAWASKTKLVLGQVKRDEKSNEIPAIPRLLEILRLEGCIVTIDAIGAQKETRRKLAGWSNEYLAHLLGVKGLYTPRARKQTRAKKSESDARERVLRANVQIEEAAL